MLAASCFSDALSIWSFQAILSLCNGDESGDPNFGEKKPWLFGRWSFWWRTFVHNHLILTVCVCENRELLPQPLITSGSSVGRGISVVGQNSRVFMSTCIWGCLKFRDAQYYPPKCSILLDPSFWAHTWKHTISLHVFPETCPNICSHWVCWIWCNIFFHSICSNLRRVTPFVESLFFGQEKASGDDLDDVSDLFVE